MAVEWLVHREPQWRKVVVTAVLDNGDEYQISILDNGKARLAVVKGNDVDEYHCQDAYQALTKAGDIHRGIYELD